MPHSSGRKSRYDLSSLPLSPKDQFWNLTTAPLYEAAIRRGEARMAAEGPLVAQTGRHTGRSAQDKYIVENDASREAVWWGPVNQALSQDRFDALYQRMLAYLSERDVFVQDLWGGSHNTYRLGVRVITELAWHSLFARTMLVRPEESELADFAPEFTVINAPGFAADPERDEIGRAHV